MKFVSLDALRGIAALGVVIIHAGFPFRTPWLPSADHLYLLVDFFFVLSGFVITHAYGSRVETISDLRVFVLRRIGRVWPLHAALMLFLFLIELLKAGALLLGSDSFSPFEGIYDIGSFTENLFLLNSFGFTNGVTWNVPSWSISAEMGVYLIFAAIVYLALPFRIAAGLIVVISMIALITISPMGMAATYEMGLVRAAAGFFAGCLAYQIYKTRPLHASAVVWTIAEALLLIFVVAFLACAKLSWLSYFAPLVFSAAVLVFSADGGLFSRILSTRMFSFLGRISYSVYMTHYVLLGLMISLGRVMERVLPEATVGAVPFASESSIALLVLLTVIVSSLTYRFIEKPGIAFFRQLETVPVVPSRHSKA